eukprot:6176491-Pleurochrysis_carterae.AAC.1
MEVQSSIILKDGSSIVHDGMLSITGLAYINMSCAGAHQNYAANGLCAFQAPASWPLYIWLLSRLNCDFARYDRPAYP